MPTLVLASERMMRSVMTSRLPREGAGVRRETAVVWAVVAVCVFAVDLVATDLVDAVFEEGFGLRPFVLVLKGLAMGARLMVPSAFVADFAECFLDASVDGSVEVASEVAPPEMARTSSAVVRRRDNIYCTPVGWVEVAEMTGAGSFGWGPG